MSEPRVRDGLTWLNHVLAWPLVVIVRIYQIVISPLTPPSCKFYPCCSSYGVTALRRFGLVRGGWLTVRRLARCHPWSLGGVDHVPPLSSQAIDSMAPTAVRCLDAEGTY